MPTKEQLSKELELAYHAIEETLEKNIKLQEANKIIRQNYTELSGKHQNANMIIHDLIHYVQIRPADLDELALDVIGRANKYLKNESKNQH